MRKIKNLNFVFNGEVAEWLKAHAWKACKGAILSWVRIPFSPPLNKLYFSRVIKVFKSFFVKINQQFF